MEAASPSHCKRGRIDSVATQLASPPSFGRPVVTGAPAVQSRNVSEFAPETLAAPGVKASRAARFFAAAPLVLGVVLAAIYLVGEVSHLQGELGFPLDDSWIHLQFARNLARGEGLSFNAGELVPGSTAPLWTALLSLLFLLPGSLLLWVKLLGTLCYLAGIDATRRLACELELGPGMAILAAAMTAATSWLVWAAMSGMEVPLFTLLSVWGMILHIRERRDPTRSPLSLLVFGVAVLARPEGLLLIMLAIVDRCLNPKRDEAGDLALARPPLAPIIWGSVAAAIIILPMAAFNTVLSGSALPTTFSAKSSGVAHLLPSLHAIYETLSIFFSSQPYFTFTAIAGCLVLVERFGRARRTGLLPGLWLIGLPLAYSTLGGMQQLVLAGNFGRYYFPLFPVLVVLGVLGIDRAARATGGIVRAGSLRVPVAALGLVLLAWPAVTGVYRGLGRHLQSVGNVHQSDVGISRWLAGRLSPDAVLAVNDVGAIKFLLPNRIVDMAGIINPEIMRYMGEARESGRDWHEGVLRFLEETRPDYLVIFPEWFPRLAQLDPRYEVEHVLEIPQNITMGGNRLAVFRTPWTRFPLLEPGGTPSR